MQKYAALKNLKLLTIKHLFGQMVLQSNSKIKNHEKTFHISINQLDDMQYYGSDQSEKIVFTI